MKCKMCGNNHEVIRNGICLDCFQELSFAFGDETPTLRDQFAMAALTGMFMVKRSNDFGELYCDMEYYCDLSYKYADAMIEARKQDKGGDV